MNELLQKHGCSNVFTIPEGLKELMTDITREVLRDQPPKIFDYIANYLSVLLITREHGILAVKILDDLCDCRPSVSEHLLQLGMDLTQAETLAEIIKEEIEKVQPVEGKEKVKETHILKRILNRTVLDEEMTAHVCQVARNAYRDFWYRKMMMEKDLNVQPEEAWEVAAERTLELYKKTKPSFNELTRATQMIQAAYRGYYVRRRMLRHLKPKKKTGPKVELPGPPIDVAGSREIDLGPVLDLKIRDEDTTEMFQKAAGKKLGIHYDPTKTLTLLDDEEIRDRRSARFGPEPGESAPSSHVALSAKKSASTRMDPLEQEGLPPLDVPSSRRVSSIVSEIPELDAEAPINKISFADVKLDMEEQTEIPEEIPNEIIEEGDDYGGDDAEGDADEIVEDDAQEVPEDIPDNRTDHAPTASVPSSAPDTDFEEAGDVATEEEEE